jgi:predicted Zn-ribbon and HTH transcriptional regulator
MDESVDQVMGRSADEKGADKAVALRRGQAKDRARLLQDIEAEQKTISSLNEERAPIAAEVRKVEAEVGPIKYIAAFFYGSTDPGILEKAVTWVIITLIVVFDPLAVILLLASQMSFQEFREREGKATGVLKDNDGTIVGLRMPKKEVEETPTVEELKEIDEPVVEKSQGTEFEPIDCSKCGTELVEAPNIGLHCPNPECGVIQEPKIEDFTAPVAVQATPEVGSEYVFVNGQTYHRNAAPSGYVQNEEQKVSNKWTNTITSEEYLKTSKDKKA